MLRISPYFLLGLMATPVFAEDHLDALFLLSLEELLKVKVTGSTLTDESLKSVPASVSVFSHDQIKNMGLDSLDELMNMVPGFQSYRTSYTSLHAPFSSRGRRIGITASEVLVLVDGMRLEDPSSSGAGELAAKIPLLQIERVEFIRGPGSAIYGSNAMMGVINIITVVGVNRLGFGYGNLNRRRAHLLTSNKMADVSVDLFGQIEADDGDNLRVQDTFGSNRINTRDPRQLADLTAKFHWKKTKINLRHNQFESEGFYELNTISDKVNKRSGQLNSISLKQDFNWETTSSWLWLSYSYSKLNITGQLTAPGDLASSSVPPSDDPLIFDVDFDDFSESRMQWHNNWEFNSLSSLQFGAEYRHIDAPGVIVKSNFDVKDLASGDDVRYYGAILANSPVQAQSSRDILGFYAQYQTRLIAQTHLTLGLRYDDFSNISTHLSPRFGLVQELDEHNSLKLLYGEAFRAPAEIELNLQNNPVLSGNLALKPEVVQSWELIWVGQWPHTGLSFGYFENNFSDSIVQASIGSGLLQYKNVDLDPVKGFEFELSHELDEYWRLRASYTYFNEKADLSFREADQLVSLMANYQSGNWNANIIAGYHNERDLPAVDSNNNRITLDDGWLMFAKLSYSHTSNWQSNVQVKNLLNEEYQTPSESASVSEGVPNRGREILLELNYWF